SMRTHPLHTAFPYTTLFRSDRNVVCATARTSGDRQAIARDSFIVGSKRKSPRHPRDARARILSAKAEAPSTECRAPERNCRKVRSEEHTSELQSLRHLVCRL